jgi:RNA polymerase sigma-70 factor (ECF subfamily)
VVEAEAKLKALMLAGLGGDEAAHRQLLTEISTHLRAYFRFRLQAYPEDAEDLVQETLIAIHTKRHTYDPAYPVTAWIYAIARYRMIDLYRRRKRRGVQIPIDDVEGLFANADDAAADAKRDVAHLLKHLPEKQRAAITLVKLEGLSVHDAAQRLNLSESDIKISIHRGMKKLSLLITEEAA